MYLKYRLMYTEVASSHHSHYDYINAVIENKIIFKSCFSFLQSNKKFFVKDIYFKRQDWYVSDFGWKILKSPPHHFIQYKMFYIYLEAIVPQ